MATPEVYISHAWGGESDVILQKIVHRLEHEKINLVYDHKDLQYRGSIRSFMDELGKSKAVVIILSNKYLHSEYCMFELLQIYNNERFMDRIFPVVLDEVNIAKSTERIELVKYWENQSFELEEKIRELRSLSYIEGITDDLNLYGDIRKNIAKLTYILRDINTLNIRLHTEENFQSLVRQIQDALKKIPPPERATQLEWRDKKSGRVKWWVWAAPLLILLLMAGIWFLRPTKTIATNTPNYDEWIGTWQQEVQSEGAPIRGTVEISFEQNRLTGTVRNQYGDQSESTNELYDLAITNNGKRLEGKWRTVELLKPEEGTFSWSLQDDHFEGFYTVGDDPTKFYWNGKR
ncbi:MAG: toll/interleukin-1 receptor domain-containing protein [Saprospiraceae bacterium]|nr:toll/interleukin-1 receptor domain-containing protein [Saprospiraceae bacterium]